MVLDLYRCFVEDPIQTVVPVGHGGLISCDPPGTVSLGTIRHMKDVSGAPPAVGTRRPTPRRKMKSNLVRRLILIGVMVLAAGLFWYFGADRYLTLAFLKGSLEDLRAMRAAHPLTALVAYFGLYVTVTALSLPGAAVLTLAGGALFGFLTGTLVVSFASTIGATLACLAARFLLREWIQARFGNALAKVNEGIDREGAFYLFTLRLIPLFPFWMINLVMGLTKIPLWRFIWVSQLGMLAGTMVYVNAGSELAKIETFRGILSPGLVVSFALLGIFPLAAKRLLEFYRHRRRPETTILP